MLAVVLPSPQAQATWPATLDNLISAITAIYCVLSMATQEDTASNRYSVSKEWSQHRPLLGSLGHGLSLNPPACHHTTPTQGQVRADEGMRSCLTSECIEVQSVYVSLYLHTDIFNIYLIKGSLPILFLLPSSSATLDFQGTAAFGWSISASSRCASVSLPLASIIPLPAGLAFRDQVGTRTSNADHWISNINLRGCHIMGLIMTNGIFFRPT